MNSNIVIIARQLLDVAENDWRVSAGMIGLGVLIGTGHWLYRRYRRGRH